ncbi:annetocin receptor-like, partial [Physella acuta]|uniref:annetocin receptor-like n=1 Tax=Physella acuta TaxID=109671 RepID=UPI0027DBC6E3
MSVPDNFITHSNIDVMVAPADFYNLSSPQLFLNLTNTTLEGRDEDVAVVEVFVSATILFLAIVGNGCVVLSLVTKRKQMSRMHLMILHLSLADLFVAFFNVLPQLAWDITDRFQGGSFLCVFVKYMQVVAMYASSYVLLATAVDRYYAICHPFASQSWTARHAHTLAVIAWTASLLFSVPQVFIFSYRQTETSPVVYDCWAEFHPEWTLQAYVTWTATSVFVVPTCVLGVLYGKITWVVWKAGKLEGNVVVKPSSTSSVIRSLCTRKPKVTGAAVTSCGHTKYQNGSKHKAIHRDTPENMERLLNNGDAVGSEVNVSDQGLLEGAKVNDVQGSRKRPQETRRDSGINAKRVS